MIFLHPEFIYYMIIPLILFFMLVITQADKSMGVFSPEILQRLRVNNRHLSMRIRNILYFCIFLLLIVSLAQPVIRHGKIDVGEKDADIVLALDVSKSMLAQDIAPSRLIMAKYKMVGFLRRLHGNKVGCIAFAKNSFLVSPLSLDHDAVGFLIKHFHPSLIVEPGANFGQLLYSVNKMSRHKNRVKYLVVFTDGGDQKSFGDEIAYAKKHHIIVFVIAVGSSKGTPIPTQNGFLTYHGHIVISRLQTNISSLAKDTGGVYIHYILSNADINRMAQEINNIIKQNNIKLKSIPNNQPLFYIPLAIALLLLLMAMSSIPNAKKFTKTTTIMLIILLFHNTTAHAGILSYQTLDAAKKAYLNHQYAKSVKLFKEYDKIDNSSSVSYDYANALYKNKQYKKAIKQYERASFKNNIKQANLLYNMANSYAKEGSRLSLEKALKLYKQSIELKQSGDALHNKKVVEELLKRKKKQQHKKKQQKLTKQNNSSNSKNDKNKNSHRNSSKQNKQNKIKHHSSNKAKQNSVNKQNHSKVKDQSSNKQNQEHNSHTKKQQKKHVDASTPKRQQKTHSKNRQKKSMNTDQAHTLKQNSINKHEKPSKTQPSSAQYKNTMSKQEIRQWLKQIQSNAPTHVYKMKQMPTNMEDYNAKPW